VATEAMESMRRHLASELGPHGVRTVTLRTGGVPETSPRDSRGASGSLEHRGCDDAGPAATFEDVGNTAVFAASDWGRTMTAATIKVSSGALPD
jgi:3-oxoacyl-[acyl-carrier protein] reductase